MRWPWQKPPRTDRQDDMQRRYEQKVAEVRQALTQLEQTMREVTAHGR